MRLYRGQRIAASLLHREQVQKQYMTIDRSSWYEPKAHLLSPQLRLTFFPSFLDADTESFLEDSFATSSSICLQIYYAFFSFIMSFLLSKTSINGVLNRGGMFLFSPHQLQGFLNISSDWNPDDKQLLDLGAGDGGITKKLATFYSNVYVTEMSQVMQWRLRNEGFHIENVEEWSSSSRRYDLISALNLLDRHYNPRKLLRDLHSLALRSNCLVLIAVVLPIHQYVEFHPSRRTTEADERLAVEGRTIEEQASFLVDREFLPAGFELVRWTKLPYLCEGDYYKPFYVLNDVVFLVRPIPGEGVREYRTSIDSTHSHNEL
uniref:Methyltransferase-like protein 9 n=1 Tax=Haemonchus contortus TaxID=6289 RepID=A0A7I4YYH9_HAECO|nr:DREV methyltransferase domain containing protein [Haemonchus contortus]